ncbi:MAG TPA: alanine--tRNA ligase [Dehalococcoidia bacterium]|nr:alanine--tRNA ligase [Dehalococcoidia bacterium]
MMTSDEIRSAFLSFFEEKGHKIIPGSSLVPQGDPTLLLTSAGMVQFKPYFLGEEVPPSPRLASCQKCFRTTDIESVGDTGHLTFFEMLGNFSVGDYFKQEAINWAWEFVTQRLGLPPARLWITIFLNDDESFRYWRELGILEPRILRFGEEDNFWGPAGNTGPCGPCSEIHYDFGEEVGCGKPSCAPGCDCGRFSEIWNLVFTQYNQDEEGHRTSLPRPNIDTGMGLERTAAVVQGKTSVYETDLFVPLMQRISELAGKKYGSGNNDNARRIIVEHSRGIAFLIGDGVIPSNEGQGYVLRRLLRRAVLFGKRLGLDEPFLAETAKTTIQQMGHIYPEIIQRQDFITKVIELEEARFSETLNTGLELLDGIMGEAANKGENRISGKKAFKLYDTYGFPVELTSEIAAGRGLSVDLEGFELEMEKQRERARKAQVIEHVGIPSAEAVGTPGVKAVNFVGYDNLSCKSKILDLAVDNKTVQIIEGNKEAVIILESTSFYGEMGGQVGDTGEIRSPSGKFLVTNTVHVLPDIIVHQGKVVEGSLAVGDEVEADVNRERRLDIARNHTATHLLQFALRQVLGKHVQQRGSLVAPDRLRFDFSHLTAVTKEELQEIQQIVNDKIRQNLTVYDEDIPYKRAIDDGAIAIFDEKYGDVVRVLKIGEPVISAELCGGTHVAQTGEIGFFHIISESSIGAGMRRIEAVTGRGAVEYVDRHLSSLEKVAQLLGTSTDNVQDQISSLITELDKEGKQRLVLERELSKKIAESLAVQAEVINGVRMLASRVPSSRLEALREMGDLLREKLKSAVIVLGTVYEDKPVFLATITPDLVAKGYNAGDIVKQVAEVTGGGGGGKAQFGQAGGKDKDKIDEALELVKSLI